MKAKIKATITFEYELKPEYYPEDKTPDEMIMIDIANFGDDIYMLADSANTFEGTLTIIGSVESDSN